MSDVEVVIAAARAPRSRVRQPKTNLPAIEIAGETWKPRKDFAADIGVCDATVKRMNLPTVLVGGVAYVNVKDGLCEIAGRARRRKEAPREISPVRRRLRR
jgi:hypothetical protein